MRFSAVSCFEMGSGKCFIINKSEIKQNWVQQSIIGEKIMEH